jgi:hypothetical protein
VISRNRTPRRLAGRRLGSATLGLSFLPWSWGDARQSRRQRRRFGGHIHTTVVSGQICESAWGPDADRHAKVLNIMPKPSGPNARRLRKPAGAITMHWGDCSLPVELTRAPAAPSEFQLLTSSGRSNGALSILVCSRRGQLFSGKLRPYWNLAMGFDARIDRATNS